MGLIVKYWVAWLISSLLAFPMDIVFDVKEPAAYYFVVSAVYILVFAAEDIRGIK